MSDTLIKDVSPPGQEVAPEANMPPTVDDMAEPETGRIRVGSRGRVELPVEACRELGIDEGDELCVLVEDDMIKLMTRQRLIRLIRDAFDEYPGSLVEEMLAERQRARELQKRALEDD